MPTLTDDQRAAINEARRTLQTAGVSPRAYRLDGTGGSEECYALSSSDAEWVVSRTGERGSDQVLQRFAAFDDALRDIVRRVVADHMKAAEIFRSQFQR